jgi:hypothetical protein
MEPELADETWGKLGGEITPVPVVAPPEIAELMLFEAIWLFQLRLWLDLIEAWWAPPVLRRSEVSPVSIPR